jgi:hypothetical protein
MVGLTDAQPVASVRIGAIVVSAVSARCTVGIETVFITFAAYLVAFAPGLARITVVLLASP